MGKIEDLLAADEKVMKKQSRTQMVVGGAGMPAGDLYLTNKRLIFLVSKGWSVLTPGAGLGSNDVTISLRDIKSVKKGLGMVQIQADRDYGFSVSAWHQGSWVDAIKQAIALYPPPATQPAPPQPPPQATEQVRQTGPPPSTRRFCPNCGNPLRPEARFCESCGTKLQ